MAWGLRNHRWMHVAFVKGFQAPRSVHTLCVLYFVLPRPRPLSLSPSDAPLPRCVLQDDAPNAACADEAKRHGESRLFQNLTEVHTTEGYWKCAAVVARQVGVQEA